MTQVFRATRRVEFVDTDMAGVVHFSNYFRWMEAAETDFLRARGLSVALTWQGQSLGFPRVAVSCKYLLPVRFEDVLDIAVRIERLGKKSVTYAFDFFKGPDLVARGEATAVCCRLHGEHGLEAIDIPDDLRARLSP